MQHPAYSPLFTDFYELTMAHGYWRLDKHQEEAVFHYFFRMNPFGGNYALSCGLQSLVDFLKHWQFNQSDLDYLSTLHSFSNQRIFPDDFLHYLKGLQFCCDIDAIPEGCIVFAHEPLLRIQGPLIQCQLVETALLNILNFQTLIATKASKICKAAGMDEVIEFGMRRAQGPDGALSASRAAYIGGCSGTSNTLAGKLFDIPTRGTHAHSWVSAFANEEEAFNAYAKVMPHHCIFLVDTYDTLTGVQHAISVGKKLKQEGNQLIAIRLDSGNMKELSIKARELLDAAGFKDTKIIASNSLDESIISDLKAQGAKIDVWGVGTQLVTAYDHAALDGVYKLTALRENGSWQYKFKLSEQTVKHSIPGRQQVRRYFFDEQYVMDVIYDIDLRIADIPETVLLDKNLKNVRLDDYDAFVDLLQPIMRQGKLVKALPNIHDIRNIAKQECNDFFKHHQAKPYPIALEKQLHDIKNLCIGNFVVNAKDFGYLK